jgi:hypothetical protein
MARIPVTLFALWATFVFFGQPAFSQANCDPSIKGNADRPEGYRQRGDRCEGVYWQPHATESGLFVVGFRRFAQGPQAMSDPIHLGWKKQAAIPANSNILLKATLLRSDMFYRMDTSRTYSNGSYDWPTDVLRSLRVNFSDLGMLAVASTKIGKRIWSVYLPLELTSEAAQSTTYEVTLVSNTALTDLSWNCQSTDADGYPARKLAGADLDKQFPAGVPIRIQIMLPQYDGAAYVEITANSISPTITEPLTANFTFFAGH